MAEEYDPFEEWRRSWEASKRKMKAKIRMRKEKWKTRATSDAAEKAWKEEVIKAAEKQLRKKALEQVDPNDWADQVAAGVDEKTITDIEVRNFRTRAGPYVELVQEIAAALDETALRGPEKAVWWAQNVLPKLEEAKGDPSKIPQIRSELLAKIRALPRAVTARA